MCCCCLPEEWQEHFFPLPTFPVPETTSASKACPAQHVSAGGQMPLLGPTSLRATQDVSGHLRPGGHAAKASCWWGSAVGNGLQVLSHAWGTSFAENINAISVSWEGKPAAVWMVSSVPLGVSQGPLLGCAGPGFSRGTASAHTALMGQFVANPVVWQHKVYGIKPVCHVSLMIFNSAADFKHIRHQVGDLKDNYTSAGFMKADLG